MSGSLHRFGGEAVRGPVQTYLVEVAGLGQQLHFSSNSSYHILPLDRQVRRPRVEGDLSIVMCTCNLRILYT